MSTILTPARRNAITIGSPADVDASALTEVNINSSDNTRRFAISNLYKTLPDHSLRNSNCKGLDVLNPYKDNLFSRVKRWIDEEYYITEVSVFYKIITVLNVGLLICVIVLSYRLWLNDCELVVTAKVGKEVDPDSLKSLDNYKRVMDYVNPSISVIVFIYSFYRVFKRTTKKCDERDGSYRVGVSG